MFNKLNTHLRKYLFLPSSQPVSFMAFSPSDSILVYTSGLYIQNKFLLYALNFLSFHIKLGDDCFKGLFAYHFILCHKKFSFTFMVFRWNHLSCWKDLLGQHFLSSSVFRSEFIVLTQWNASWLKKSSHWDTCCDFEDLNFLTSGANFADKKNAKLFPFHVDDLFFSKVSWIFLYPSSEISLEYD